ncbi:class I SAM-dependent methyltransferase [Lederbergia sp. NSJ-179]|uniref:class I SAM-dependent methyltransferase n=1 Tax=Lederbergia sp. NSJ-179 TaxID=2931402 RepID=UPI001FD38204|nr:class I SAM-dependent methyltransferase [Lederbergia sp. NSJ-179]MCJ7842398.1 class I SAM-dependent methyltransferase [Lederbergia sp. NSJ-179]
MKMTKLYDPTNLPDWVPPHSLKWYNQLSRIQGIYEYSWDSTHTEPNGESVFDKEVAQMIQNKKVLDVGCGHGEFTNQCGSLAKEITGLDATEAFIKVGDGNRKPNVSFVVGNTKQGLPFAADTFDCVYIRKGPTSVYPYLPQVVKKGGEILALHPGDEAQKEFPQLFPNLFEESTDTPVLHVIRQVIEKSHFTSSKIEIVNSIEYFHTPLDVIKRRCFGQTPKVFEKVKDENLNQISKVFEEKATEKGLAVTQSYYLVRAIV